MMKVLPRPKIPVEVFEKALLISDLTEDEYELIDYIRHIGVFTQPLLVKDLRLKPKPPALSILCEACRKLGKNMPTHFEKVRSWSKSVSEYGVRWDGDLVCSAACNIDGEPLTPDAGTTPYDTLVVHKELFKGLD